MSDLEARPQRATSVPRWAVLLAVVVCALLVVVLAIHPSETSHQPGVHQPPRAATTARPPGDEKSFLLGNFGSAVNQTGVSGSVPVIDIPSTIAALQTAHVTTYAYLICPDQTGDPMVSRTQFEELPRFAAAAAQADISVYVYLVPPTEASEKSYAPFGWDYVSWGRAIGALAATAPAIKGIVIDDFGGNTFARAALGVRFTPTLVEHMMSAARRGAARLEFIPVLYHHDVLGRRAILADYRHVISGVIFPYFGSSDGRTRPGNTFDTTLALSQGSEISGQLKCPVSSGCQQIQFPIRPKEQRAIPTASLTAVVTPTPNEKRIVTMATNHDAGTATHPGHHIEVVVDGKLAGSALPGRGWTRRTFDVTAITSGRKQATISIRIVRAPKAPTRLAVQLSDIQVIGVQSPVRLQLRERVTPGVLITRVADKKLIFMTYATPLSAERGRGASPGYVQNVLMQVARLKEDNLIDGSMIFQLPLPGSVPNYHPSNYWLVSRIYAEWAAG